MNLYGSGAVREMKRAEMQNKGVDSVQVNPVILQLMIIYKPDFVPSQTYPTPCALVYQQF